MRAGSSSRGAYASQNVPLLYFLPCFHIDVRKVEVHADQSVAVVEEHGIAGEKHVFREHHFSGCYRNHRTTNGRRVIDSHMRLRIGFPIVVALYAKGFSWRQRGGRRTQRKREARDSASLCKDPRELSAILRIAAQICGGWMRLGDVGKHHIFLSVVICLYLNMRILCLACRITRYEDRRPR